MSQNALVLRPNAVTISGQERIPVKMNAIKALVYTAIRDAHEIGVTDPEEFADILRSLLVSYLADCFTESTLAPIEYATHSVELYRSIINKQVVAAGV